MSVAVHGTVVEVLLEVVNVPLGLDDGDIVLNLVIVTVLDNVTEVVPVLVAVIVAVIVLVFGRCCCG